MQCSTVQCSTVPYIIVATVQYLGKVYELGYGPGWPGFCQAVVREAITDLHLPEFGPCPKVGGRGSNSTYINIKTE